MKFQKVAICLMLLTSFVCVIKAQTKTDSKAEKENSGIIYSGKTSFILSAPKNWVMDGTSGRNQGVAAVFYQQGSTWQNSITAMYVNVYEKNSKLDTVEKIIENDIKDFRDNSDKLKVEDLEPLSTSKKNQKTIIKYFTGDQYGNHEVIAYIDEEKAVTMIVLTAKNKKDFDSSFPSFKELVSSYFFLTSDVKLENK
jgi:hypothetical protein